MRLLLPGNSIPTLGRAVDTGFENDKAILVGHFILTVQLILTSLFFFCSGRILAGSDSNVFNLNLLCVEHYDFIFDAP